MGSIMRSMWIVVVSALACAFLPSQGPAGPEDGDFTYPVVAMKLLADGAREKCVICAEDLRKKSYAMLDREFRPGRTFVLPGGGRCVRGEGGAQELRIDRGPDNARDVSDGMPRLVARFHTKADKMVGIGAQGLTGEGVLRAFKSIPAGREVAARIQMVAFEYGNGSCFHYSASGHVLVMHCRLLGIGRR